MELWWIGFAANVIVSVAYLAIAYHIYSGISAEKQWRRNPLALATAAIFLTCGVGHGIHPFHALFAHGSITDAMRVELADPTIWIFDGITAVVAVWYWTLRGRFPALVRGAALFEDMHERQRRALEIHDNVVQGLVKAKMSYEFGQGAQALVEIEQTLEASRRIMSDLLGEAPKRPIKPGELRRDTTRRD